MIDLSRITRVIRSDWTGDLFMDESEAGERWYLCRGYTPDAADYKAVEAFIANWEQVVVEQGNYTEYRRE